MKTNLDEVQILTMPGRAVTAPMTWAKIERELTRRGFAMSRPIAHGTDCVRWSVPVSEEDDRCGPCGGTGQALTAIPSRCADCDGTGRRETSPGEPRKPNARVYTRSDFSNTWPQNDAQRMSEAIERIAELDGVSPAETILRINAAENAGVPTMVRRFIVEDACTAPCGRANYDGGDVYIVADGLDGAVPVLATWLMRGIALKDRDRIRVTIDVLSETEGE